MTRIAVETSVALFLLALAAGRAVGQKPQLKRDVPVAAWAGCPAFTPPGSTAAADRTNAERLAAEATQASILGDNAAAQGLLGRAAALDPASAKIAYRLARTLEELNRPKEARAAFCRYIGLAADAPDAAEVRARIAALADTAFAVPAAAATAFRSGLASYDAGRLEHAEAAFGEAYAAAASWSAAVYNRGVVRLELGREDEALADLRMYLQLSPEAPDFARVQELVTALPQRAPAQYRPASALVAGLVAPGLGHLTTGRPAMGAAVLGAAAGTLAAGLMMRRVEVECLSPPVAGQCPTGQVLRQRQERPYLVPAVGAAALIGVLGAIDAYRGARRRNAQAAERETVNGTSRDASLRLDLPDLHVGPSGATLDVIRLRF